jgi:integrase
VTVEYHHLEGQFDRLRALMADLVRRRVAVIVANGTTVAVPAKAAKVAPSNPASAVRGPKHVVKTGKTPVLDGKEWRRLIDTIPTETVRDLRDRALIATLTYGFARVGAALKMRVEDLQAKGSGWLIRLHEKGGKQHMMPCHHALAEALHAYIDAAGIYSAPAAGTPALPSPISP